MGLDQAQQSDDNRRIKSLVEVCCAEQVPRVDHEVDEPKPQECGGGDVAVRMGNGLLRRGGGERLGLESGRLNHSGDWIIPELITAQHGPSFVSTNACQQERREPIADHNVLNQLAY